MIQEILIGLIAIAAVTAIAVKFRNKRKQAEQAEVEYAAAAVSELLEALANMSPEDLLSGKGLPEGWSIVTLPKSTDDDDELPNGAFESRTKH